MICKRCGTPLEEGQRFCTKCGTPVTAPAAEPVSAGPADTVLMPGVRGADPETGAVATPAAPATPPRKRRTGLWVGLAAAAVVVILLLALGVPALLRAMNPAVYLFDSLVNTGTTLAQEQETLQKNLGLNRAIEQSVITQSVRLEELPVDGPEADMLKGLQFTVRSQSDLEARRSWFTYTLDMGDFTVLLMDVWLDDEMIAFASPQLTTGRWYGTLNEGFGAQINRLLGSEALDPEMDLAPYADSYNWLETGKPLDPATTDAMWEATRTLLDELAHNRGTGGTVSAQGQDRKLDQVTVSAPREALTVWANACADALLADPNVAEVLKSLMMSDPSLTMDSLRQSLDSLLADLPETLDMEFLIRDKQVVRVTVDQDGGVLQLELGMDGTLLDVLALRALADDGTEVTVLEMNGAHTAPDGHLTTSGRITLYGETPVTFTLDLDSKKADENLSAEMLIDDGWGGTIRLAATGSWLADPNAQTLTMDLSDLSMEANGMALRLSTSLSITPGEPLDELSYTPTLLNDMSDIEVQEFLFSLLGEYNSMVYAPLTGSNMW